MKKNRFKVSIVIPTKNRCESLKKCLESLTKQTYNNFEIIIVDGGSKDGTRNLIKNYDGILSIKYASQSGGLVAQMNKGIELAEGEIFIRTDDDVMMDSKWLETIVETFDYNPMIGGVTGPTIIPNEYIKARDLFFFQERFKKGNMFWRILGKIYYNYFMEGQPMRVSHWFRCGAFSLGSNFKSCLEIKELLEVNNLEACNWAVRRELLEKIRGFDPLFGRIGEYHEADASFKIMKLGYKLIFNPKAVVYHQPSIEGFYKDRPASYSRICNFINFYFRHIKPNTLDKFIRFSSYLLFLNGFFIYKAITAKQVNQLGCIPGTIVGLGKNIFRLIRFRLIKE